MNENTGLTISAVAAMLLVGYIGFNMIGCAVDSNRGTDITRQTRAVERTKQIELLCTKDIETTPAKAMLCQQAVARTDW